MTTSSAPYIDLNICFTGGRDYNDFNMVLNVLKGLKPKHVHVGCARGLDALVRKACTHLKVPFTVYYADWDNQGKSAGIKRNIRMLETSHPDILVSFPGGKGTTHCTQLARRMSIPIIYISNEKGDVCS